MLWGVTTLVHTSQQALGDGLDTWQQVAAVPSWRSIAAEKRISAARNRPITTRAASFPGAPCGRPSAPCAQPVIAAPARDPRQRAVTKATAPTPTNAAIEFAVLHPDPDAERCDNVYVYIVSNFGAARDAVASVALGKRSRARPKRAGARVGARTVFHIGYNASMLSPAVWLVTGDGEICQARLFDDNPHRKRRFTKKKHRPKKKKKRRRRKRRR